MPNSEFVDLTSVLNLAPDLFRSSLSASNKILVLFTNSPLPYDVSALATAARNLNGRDVKVVVVNTGIRTDHSNWLPIPSLVVSADPGISDQRRTVYQIGNLVYRGKYDSYIIDDKSASSSKQACRKLIVKACYTQT